MCAALYISQPLEFLGKHFINFVFYTVRQGEKGQNNALRFSIYPAVLKNCAHWFSDLPGVT